MEIIRAEHLTKTFDARREQVHALRDVSFSIEKGEIFGVIGLSGAGKSTLVRCLNLLERPTSGQVFIDGRELTALNAALLREARRKIGMIFQEFNLLMQRSVLDNVCFPMEIAGGIKLREARERAMEYLRTVGLEEKAGAYPAQLSGGQKQRIAIVRALAMKPKVMLFDEPTSALDAATAREIQNTILHVFQGKTILMITHDLSVIGAAGQIVVMDQGKVLASGTHSALLESCALYKELVEEQAYQEVYA